MGVSDLCTIGLDLGLGFPSPAVETSPKIGFHKPIKGTSLPTKLSVEPSLSLALSGESSAAVGTPCQKGDGTGVKAVAFEDNSAGQTDSSNGQHASPPHSTVSSFSSLREAAKRVRTDAGEAERGLSKVGEEDDADGVSARKKLRLTKEQSATLEECFKLHSTLQPKQKQSLARQLNLRPRQVEVWFQNRRARTKLKQTEVDCELLKKCCETLRDENRRLQKELQELKTLKLLGHPFYKAPTPAETLALCPSCERVGGGTAAGNGSTKISFSMASKAHHFYSRFSNPPAAY
ncbi:hypothetical protein SAY87_009145 [Trapa incisa]|uniref:Homeobox domain-containing protein n=1 Tax=Trapa incisa TaxID=236973 RepID=A0AAN7PXC4_9MYRT|nr:hypothetical protein SAY87_009145 [Trapa incisa]